jgi:hypothetical protein
MTLPIRVGQPGIAVFDVYDDDDADVTTFDASAASLAMTVARIGETEVAFAGFSDKAADDTAHAPGAIRKLYNNRYTIDLPTAATATWVRGLAVRGTFTGGRIEGVMHPMAGYDPSAVAVGAGPAVWDRVLTGATHNVPNSAGRRLRTLADTVVLNEGDVIAADNNGEINGENGLGRVTFASDVGTVCVGQAVRVSGQVRYVETYDQPTQTATVDSPWCVIPTVGDEYTIFSQRSSLVMRINAAASGTIAFVIAKLWEMIEDVSGWRFNAKAVELAAVTVLPATGTAAGRGDRSTLVVFVGETITTSITVYQADGVTPLSLSGKSLVMVFEDKAGNDVATIVNANITVSGPNDNIVTFAYPSAVSQIERTLRWSLRDDAAPDTVYLTGLVEVRRAAFVDPS